jgi:hypothetical protein
MRTSMELMGIKEEGAKEQITEMKRRMKSM